MALRARCFALPSFPLQGAQGLWKKNEFKLLTTNHPLQLGNALGR